MTTHRSLLREYFETIIFAVLLFIVIKTDVVQAFRIPSGSMEDTLLIGDFLLVNKFIYGPQVPFTDFRLPGLRDPRPGDVIIFPFPEDPSKDYIKRCIAVAGQAVQVKDKVVYVDGKPVSNPTDSKFTDTAIYPANHSPRDSWGPKIVPEGHLFVMGDNRDNSSDSRFWGFVDKETVKGKAFILYWSWDWQPEDPTLAWSWSQPVQSIVSLTQLVGYNIIHTPWRVRWSRIGHVIE